MKLLLILLLLAAGTMSACAAAEGAPKPAPPAGASARCGPNTTCAALPGVSLNPFAGRVR